MELQTLLIWGARLACPLAIGLMIWWMLRQSNQAPEGTPTRNAAQSLTALHQRRAALDAEIQALEAKVGQAEAVEHPPSPEVETPAA